MEIIKNLLPELIPYLYSIDMYQGLVDDAASLVTRMVIFGQSKEDRITPEEAHKILNDMNEQSRIHVIASLRKIGRKNENGWEKLVLPFVAKSWPVEQKFRCESAVVEWVLVLSETDESFPTVFPKIREFLFPASIHDEVLSNYLTSSKGQYSLACRFPGLVLELLDKVVSDSPSNYDYQLVQILQQTKSRNEKLSFREEFKRLEKIAMREKSVWKGF